MTRVTSCLQQCLQTPHTQTGPYDPSIRTAPHGLALPHIQALPTQTWVRYSDQSQAKMTQIGKIFSRLNVIKSPVNQERSRV